MFSADVSKILHENGKADITRDLSKDPMLAEARLSTEEEYI